MKCLILMVFVLLLTASFNTSVAGAADAPAVKGVVVIVNSDGPLTAVTPEVVRDIYLGEVRITDGITLEPVNYREGPVKDVFLSEVVKLSSREYKLLWVKLVFREGLRVPGTFGSSYDVIEHVVENKGGVGYVPSSELERLGEVEGVTILWR